MPCLVNVLKTFAYKKEVAKSSFRHFTIFNEDLVGLFHVKTHLFLNKPIACGMAIIELSNVIMYSFYYDHVKGVYGDNVKLLATDTDSLILHIKTMMCTKTWRGKHICMTLPITHRNITYTTRITKGLSVHSQMRLLL